jgi:hypothetical protein
VSDIQQSRRYHHMGRRASLRDDDRSRASHWHQQIFDLTKPPTPPCGKPNSMRDVNENRSPDFYQWTYVCRYLAVNGNCGDFKVMSMWCSCPRRCRPKRRLLLQLQWQRGALQMKIEILSETDKEKQVVIIKRNNLRKYYHGIPSLSSQVPL